MCREPWEPKPNRDGNGASVKPQHRAGPLPLPISRDANTQLSTYIERKDAGYYLAGTRISLDSIVHAFRRGESPETICQNFELLRLEEVYGAIAFYLANQADIDAYLLRQDEKWTEGRRDADPLPDALRERLARARR